MLIDGKYLKNLFVDKNLKQEIIEGMVYNLVAIDKDVNDIIIIGFGEAGKQERLHTYSTYDINTGWFMLIKDQFKKNNGWFSVNCQNSLVVDDPKPNKVIFEVENYYNLEPGVYKAELENVRSIIGSPVKVDLTNVKRKDSIDYIKWDEEWKIDPKIDPRLFKVKTEDFKTQRDEIRKLYEIFCLGKWSTVKENDMKDQIRSILINEEEKLITVVFKDGDVQIVKCAKVDIMDDEIGVSLAIARHFFKSKTQLRKFISKKAKRI